MSENPPFKPQLEEAINHPKHYNMHPSGVECIEIVERLSFNEGNAIKYLFRAGHKSTEVEDLKKAHWYLWRERHYAMRGLWMGEPSIGKRWREDLARVLEHEPLGSTLGEVLRALYVSGLEPRSHGQALEQALARVSHRLAVLGAAP